MIHIKLLILNNSEIFPKETGSIVYAVNFRMQMSSDLVKTFLMYSLGGKSHCSFHC